MARFFAPIPLGLSSMAVAVLGVGLQLGGVQNSIFAIICYVLAFFLFVGFLTSVIRPPSAA